MVQLSHMYMATGKTVALTIWAFVGKLISLLIIMLSKFVIAFLPKSKCLFISWLQSPSAVTLEPKKIKCVTTPTFYPSICHEVMGPDAMILVFWMLSSKPAYYLSSFTFNKRLFSYIVKAMVFPVVMCGCESWTVKKAECRGPAPVDPGNSKVGTASLSLEIT